MTTITQTISTFTNPINRDTQTPAQIATAGDTTISEWTTIIGEENTWAGQVNTVAGEVNSDAAAALSSKNDAETAQTAAETAETNAETAETNAETAETNAETAETNASNYAAALNSTSTSSLLIEVAEKTFTTQASKQFAAGQYVLAVSDANTANYMSGQVTSYSSTTLVVDVAVIGGSGTLADWSIFVSGPKGATGAAGTMTDLIDDTTPQLGGDLDLNGHAITGITTGADISYTALAVADLSDTATPSVLTTAETTGKLISNYKSSGADHVFTMPAAHTKGNVIFIIGDEFQIDIEPVAGDLFYLNGTAMAADEHIQNTADTLGDQIVGMCANINGTLRWMFKSDSANFVEENA